MIIKGPYTNIWGNPEIGEHTEIGAYVEIGKDVKIGDYCKIEAKVFIPPGWEIGDNVFIGPGVMFANDKYPKAQGEWKLMWGRVGDGTSIGIGSIILPVFIGKNCIIGAGSVVTRDVPDGAIVYGNPAKQH